ncbi:pilus assembly protein TadE [Spiractinospora alimapuensis]|nr:pilus assembly protein TadE [Spiractinospora alimapuensis]
MEFAAYLPILLLVVVVALETFLTFVAMERMHSAAGLGARLASTDGVETARAAAERSLPEWVAPEEVTVAVDGEGGYYGEVTANVPFLFPAAGLDFPVSRRVDMPAT